MPQQVRILAGAVADARGERAEAVVTLAGGRIVEIAPLNDVGRPERGDIDARDCLLVPGFLDIHVHGGAGRAVMEATPDALKAVAAHLARHGVTGFLPTTVTGPWDLQAGAVAAASTAMRSRDNGAVGAAVLGVHLEGPYINPAKKGAQPLQFIETPDAAGLQAHLGDSISALKVVTLAPEMEGADRLIQFLTENGIISSLGHTDATYAQVCRAVDLGARHVTHCFNAMRALGSREPGVVGATLSLGGLTAELIWDNIHVHAGSCRALINAKGASRVILISDGIPGAGMHDGYTFSLGDLPVTIQNGAARLPDGTLAGSLLTLDRAFANAAEFGRAAQCAMTSRNAAVALGLGMSKGLIAPGHDADLVLLRSDGSVGATLVAGRTVYGSESGPAA